MAVNVLTFAVYCNAVSAFCTRSVYYLMEVKQSRYSPGVAQRVPSKLRFPDFMTTAQDGGKVVSLTHRSPLPPVNTPGTHFC